ncbi:hypothetical protein QTP88_005127 [Uroleucon formosanum]
MYTSNLTSPYNKNTTITSGREIMFINNYLQVQFILDKKKPLNTLDYTVVDIDDIVKTLDLHSIETLFCRIAYLLFLIETAEHSRIHFRYLFIYKEHRLIITITTVITREYYTLGGRGISSPLINSQREEICGTIKTYTFYFFCVTIPIKIYQAFILLLNKLKPATSPIKLYLRFKFGKLPSDDFGWH